MAQYRKKPVVIEAIQFNGKNAEEIEQWSNNKVKAGPVSEDTLSRDYLEIETLEGTMTAQPNDYVIKGVKGEFYPCKPDIFEQTYDAEVTTFKERLIKEQEELNDKITKLYEFGSTEKFKEIDPVHKQLLVIQSGAMITYNETLKLRLGLL
jgi:hypothetical protein